MVAFVPDMPRDRNRKNHGVFIKSHVLFIRPGWVLVFLGRWTWVSLGGTGLEPVFPKGSCRQHSLIKIPIRRALALHESNATLSTTSMA